MHSIARFSISGLYATALLIGPVAFAEQKAPAGLSCTQAQVDNYQNSEDGKECEAQGTRDLVNGSDSIHGIYCSSSGAVACCARKDGKVVDHSCETIKAAGTGIGVKGGVKGGVLEPTGRPGLPFTPKVVPRGGLGGTIGPAR